MRIFIETIGLRKDINKLLKKARETAKPDKCILCGKTQTSFCNSHSIPHMILKTIACGQITY